MFVALAVLLSVVAFLAVAYPILTQASGSGTVTSSAQETLEELVAQRDAAFQALRELTFDHQVKKVTDEDFVVFEAHLKQVAADALRALDEWETSLDADLEGILDGGIAKSRAAGNGRLGDHRCPACGAPASPDDKFCATCGKPVPEPVAVAATAAPTCPHCGRPVTPEDRFCAGCGKPVG